MDQPVLRLLIQGKLADGRLPHTPIPSVWGGPGHGETCDGCGEMVTRDELGMEAVTAGSDHAAKVLVIDDQALLRDVPAELLELLGALA